jgi:hypothetical protein
LVVWLLVVALAASFAFVLGFYYSKAQDSMRSAYLEASALKKLREEKLDIAISILEDNLDRSLDEHWSALWAEQLVPEIFSFSRVQLSGMKFVAQYRSLYPQSETDNKRVSKILDCYRAEGLPDPVDQSADFRAAIEACYQQVK